MTIRVWRMVVTSGEVGLGVGAIGHSSLLIFAAICGTLLHMLSIVDDDLFLWLTSGGAARAHWFDLMQYFGYRMLVVEG